MTGDFKNIEIDEEEYPIFDVLDIRKGAVKLKNFCLDCGKEIGRRAKRCQSCASSKVSKDLWENPTEKMITQSKKWQKAGAETVSEKQRKASQENIKKTWNLVQTEKQKEHFKEAQKIGWSLPRSNAQKEHYKEWQRAGTETITEKQINASRENAKKMHKFNAENHNWISNPEHLFFLKCLTKMFFLKDIEKQYYLKGLNHAFDFAIPKFKLLFEIDGDYWHKDRKERDVEIDKFAKSAGWFVIRFNDEKMKTLKII